MEEIASIEQIEEMEDEEIEARMEEICSKYVKVIPAIFVEGIPGHTFSIIIPARADLTALSEAQNLPPFTLELILHYLYELNNGLESEVQEKYVLKYYEILLAMAKNTVATSDLLQEIAQEMTYLSSESIDVTEIEHSIAMAILRHANCMPATIDHLEEFAWYCRNNNFSLGLDYGEEDSFTLIVKNRRTPIETLQRMRANVIERFGEDLGAEEDEEVDECDETIVQAIDRNLKEREEEIQQKEISQYYDDPKQLKLFTSL